MAVEGQWKLLLWVVFFSLFIFLLFAPIKVLKNKIQGNAGGVGEMQRAAEGMLREGATERGRMLARGAVPARGTGQNTVQATKLGAGKAASSDKDGFVAAAKG